MRESIGVMIVLLIYPEELLYLYMKRIFFTIIIALIHIGSLYGQCNLKLDFSLEKGFSPIRNVLKLSQPDGSTTILLESSVQDTCISYPLKRLGKYRLSVFVEGKSIGCESLERFFDLTGEEYLVNATIGLEPSEGHFLITKYSNPSPYVKLKYFCYESRTNGLGPVFSLSNESRDTLYGEWLSGYFWGYFSSLKNGESDRLRCGSICTTFVDRPPLAPGKKTDAYVGSFGVKLHPGYYLFTLYYSTEDKRKGTLSLTREREHYKWMSAVENWHRITCKFDVGPADGFVLSASKKDWKEAVDYLLCDNKPLFNGGTDMDFNRWVINSMDFEGVDKTQSRVTVAFLLSEDGRIIGYKRIGGNELTSLMLEYVRAALRAPRWTPAFHEGKPCKVKLMVSTSICFR